MYAHSEDEIVIRQGQEKALTKQLDWRSEELKKVFRLLDCLFISGKYTPDGRRKRKPFPRVREDGKESSTGSTGGPVPDLPENCYSKEWMKDEGEHIRGTLRMGDPVDLTISAELQR